VKRALSSILATTLCVLSAGSPSQSADAPRPVVDGNTIVSKHDFVFAAPAKEPLEGLLLGNGDLGASVWADGETLVFTLGKNDVWDRRLNTRHDSPVIACDELIARVSRGEWKFGDVYYSQPVEGNYSPTPKPVGQVRLSGLGPISNLRLRLSDATLTFETPGGQATFFVERNRNLMLIRLPAEAAKDLRVELFRPRETLDWSKPPSFGGSPTPENARDPLNAPLGPPETGISEGVFWVLQRIPAEPTFPGGFSVAAAAALTGAEGKTAQGNDRVTCEVRSARGPWVVVAVAVRTTSDHDADLVASACRHAKAALDEDWQGIHARHADQWKQFWARSFVEIKVGETAGAALAQDAALAEELFYRNLYLLACCSRPGATAPGLFGNWVWSDYVAWHGLYMLNYNFQQTFWPAFICNHAELAQSYLDHVSEIIPRMQKNTAFAFGKDARGAYFNSSDYPIRRDEPFSVGRIYDNTMEVSAWTVQHFWRHWQYVGDRDFLERRAYPVLAEVARFYEWFLHRSQREDCKPFLAQDGRLHIFPTFSPEHWGAVTPRFERNKDSASAIGFFRYHLLAAAEAAETLKRDAEEAARWRQLAQRLPDYPTHDAPGGKIFVDVPGAPPIEYNIPVPLVPVFPAEDPLFWTNAQRVEIARRTAQKIQTNGNNSLVMLGVSRARLGLDDSLAQFLADVRKRLFANGVIDLLGFRRLGIWTENFAAAGVIAEHLLQSHPDATGKQLLRLFPAIPVGIDARFAGLVAEGGFEVSAERRGGQVTEIKLASRRGASCRLLNPWRNGSATLTAKGKTIAAITGEVLEFPTQAGETYVLAPQERTQR
jgi:alpha-L-fucosidase 2